MKTYKEMLKRAKEIAKEAHKDQKRWAGEDFYTHPEAVAKRFKVNSRNLTAWSVGRFDITVDELLDRQIVGYLHDTLEDNHEWTLERLAQEGFTKNIIDAVDAMTHRDGESYLDYILRVAENQIAVDVKRADLEHNLSTSEKLASKSMRDKWIMATWILTHANS